jgi:hypothetical protein
MRTPPRQVFYLHQLMEVLMLARLLPYVCDSVANILCDTEQLKSESIQKPAHPLKS